MQRSLAPEETPQAAGGRARSACGEDGHDERAAPQLSCRLSGGCQYLLSFLFPPPTSRRLSGRSPFRRGALETEVEMRANGSRDLETYPLGT